jgi:hypothetical protein
MKTTIAALAVTACMSAVAALADTMPARILIDTCKQTTEESVAVCSAYFMGVLETIALEEADRNPHKFCVSGVTPMQLKDRFMAHADAHPPAPHANASDIVSAVLAQAHTCH